MKNEKRNPEPEYRKWGQFSSIFFVDIDKLDPSALEEIYGLRNEWEIKGFKIVQKFSKEIRDLLSSTPKDKLVDVAGKLHHLIGWLMYMILCYVDSKNDLAYECHGERIASHIPEWWRELQRETSISLKLREHESFRSNREEVVWHPYYGTMEDFKELIEFCEKHGLTFTVVGYSEYFPGRSFKIVLRKKKT